MPKNEKQNFYRDNLAGQERKWLDQADNLPPETRDSIDDEINLARVLLKRLIANSGSEKHAINATHTIARLQQIKHILEGKQSDTLTAALDQILSELGLNQT